MLTLGGMLGDLQFSSQIWGCGGGNEGEDNTMYVCILYVLSVQYMHVCGSKLLCILMC